jgi:CRP/FNR family transcriptional regulator, cyclic AMP receptor protein
MALVSDSSWRERVAALPLESFAAGEAVFTEGTRTGRVLILKSGSVGISKSGTEIARVAEPGAMLGELSALLDLPHTADVHALEPSEFHVADAAQLLADPEALLFVASVLAQRVVGANGALLELKQQIQAGAPPGLLDKTADRIVGLLSAIGSGYLRAGAGMTGYPFQ